MGSFPLPPSLRRNLTSMEYNGHPEAYLRDPHLLGQTPNRHISPHLKPVKEGLDSGIETMGILEVEGGLESEKKGQVPRSREPVGKHRRDVSKSAGDSSVIPCTMESHMPGDPRWASGARDS